MLAEIGIAGRSPLGADFAGRIRQSNGLPSRALFLRWQAQSRRHFFRKCAINFRG